MTTATFKSDIEVVKEATVNQVFEMLGCCFMAGDKATGFKADYDGVAVIVMETVKENCHGSFQADIAARALDGARLSEKQKWCVTFAFDKLRDKVEK